MNVRAEINGLLAKKGLRPTFAPTITDDLMEMCCREFTKFLINIKNTH
jgi:hypothetical protein